MPDRRGRRFVFQVAAHEITLGPKGMAVTPAGSRKSLVAGFFTPELCPWQGRMALPAVDGERDLLWPQDPGAATSKAEFARAMDA